MHTQDFSCLWIQVCVFFAIGISSLEVDLKKNKKLNQILNQILNGIKYLVN